MRLRKKPAIVGSLIAFILLLVPAISNGAEITIQGQRAPVGQKLDAKNKGYIVVRSQYVTEACPTWQFTQTLNISSGTTFRSSGLNSGSFPQYCEQDLYEKYVHFENFKLQLTASGYKTDPAKGLAEMSFDEWIGGLDCRWSGNLQFTFVRESNIIQFENASGLKAPGCDSANFSGQFAVYAAGTSVPAIFH